jgi:hypothetical protein
VQVREKPSVLALKLIKATLFGDFSVLEHEDLTALLNGAHSMSNDDGGATLHSILQGHLNLLLRVLIECRGGFIQQKDLRLSDDGSCNGDSLLLSS